MFRVTLTPEERDRLLLRLAATRYTVPADAALAIKIENADRITAPSDSATVEDLRSVSADLDAMEAARKARVEAKTAR